MEEMNRKTVEGPAGQCLVIELENAPDEERHRVRFDVRQGGRTIRVCDSAAEANALAQALVGKSKK